MAPRWRSSGVNGAEREFDFGDGIASRISLGGRGRITARTWGSGKVGKNISLLGVILTVAVFQAE
jgi:hypothetical protein